MGASLGTLSAIAESLVEERRGRLFVCWMGMYVCVLCCFLKHFTFAFAFWLDWVS